MAAEDVVDSQICITVGKAVYTILVAVHPPIPIGAFLFTRRTLQSKPS